MGVYGRFERIKELAECIIANVEAEKAGIAMEPEPAAEPEPPCVEVIDARSGSTWLFSRIDQFELWEGSWGVWGHPRSADDGYECDGCYVQTDATPFAIWEECVRKGVPCPEPRTVGTWPKGCDNGAASQWAAIESIEPDGDGGAYIAGTRISRIRNFGPGPYSTAQAFHHQSRAHMDPAAIRAACARAGVPCVGEEPKTVTVAHGAGTMRFDRLTAIAAKLTAEDRPGLFVTGVVGEVDGATFTTTPLADIRAQAEAAEMELPKVTVRAGYDWSHIAEVQHHADGTTIFGQVDGEGIHNETSYTPAQVCQLCKLAGWPKPQVRMFCTFGDGEPCEIDPADIAKVEKVERDSRRETMIELKRWVGNSPRRYVREPVAVVDAMVAACKTGGEPDEQTDATRKEGE